MFIFIGSIGLLSLQLSLIESNVDSITRESLSDVSLSTGRDTHMSISMDPSADSKNVTAVTGIMLLYHKQQ